MTEDESLDLERYLIWPKPEEVIFFPWLRQVFHDPQSPNRRWKPESVTLAYTQSEDGRVIREFRCSWRSLAIYAHSTWQGNALVFPSEAVLTSSIAVGVRAVEPSRDLSSLARGSSQPHPF